MLTRGLTMAKIEDVAIEVFKIPDSNKWDNAHRALQNAPLNQIFFIDVRDDEIVSGRNSIAQRARERGYWAATRIDYAPDKKTARLQFWKIKYIEE